MHRFFVRRLTVAFLVCTVSLLLSCAPTASAGTVPTPTPRPAAEIPVSAEDCALDAEDLVAVLERTHPLFLTEPYPAAYLAARETFLAGAPACKTQADFRRAASLYLNSLNDGHTGVRRQSSAFSPRYAQIRIAAQANDLFLLDEDGRLTNVRVTSIGGAATADVFAVIDAYFPAENEAARDANHSDWATNADVLALAGAAEGDAVAVLLEDGGQTRTQSVSFGAEPLLRTNYSDDTAISCEMDGDVFYIDFNECDKGAALKAVCKQLKAALRGGVSKVIIDARDNPGGDSGACKTLLETLGMRVPSYGCVIRYSPLANEQRSYGQKSGTYVCEPSLDGARKNSDVALCVLINDGTFSSATMLAVWVQDGGLGTIVGYPSANAPTSFGDILTYTLPRTGVEVVMSHKQFRRPDANANQATLTPDVFVPYGEDAMPAALALLN